MIMDQFILDYFNSPFKDVASIKATSENIPGYFTDLSLNPGEIKDMEMVKGKFHFEVADITAEKVEVGATLVIYNKEYKVRNKQQSMPGAKYLNLTAV